MKKSFIFIILIILSVSFVGCGSADVSPKQTILNSIENNKSIETITYSGNIEVINKVNDVNGVKLNSEYNPLMIMDNYKIAFNGKLKDEPFYLETDMSISTNIQGMDLVYDIFMIADGNNLYIEIPSILKMVTPELNQKYLMIDISKQNITENNIEFKKDYNKLLSKLIDAVDEKDIIRKDIKSYSIVNGKVKDVVTLSMTQESLESYINNLIENDGLSEIISFVDKYSISEDMLDDFKKMKSDFDNDPQNINQIINKKSVINNFEITLVFDKDDFLRKTVFSIDTNKADEDINSIITGQFDLNTINKRIKVEKQVPSIEDVINLDNLDLSKFMNK